MLLESSSAQCSWHWCTIPSLFFRPFTTPGQRLHLFTLSLNLFFTWLTYFRYLLTLTARYAFQNDKDVCMSTSHINGQVIHFFPLNKARQRVHFAILITGLMIAIDILCVGAVFYLKFYLVRILQYYNGDVIAEVVNAAQILILAELYTHIGESDSLSVSQSSIQSVSANFFMSDKSSLSYYYCFQLSLCSNVVHHPIFF